MAPNCDDPLFTAAVIKAIASTGSTVRIIIISRAAPIMPKGLSDEIPLIITIIAEKVTR